jgi:hypothetical protein
MGKVKHARCEPFTYCRSKHDDNEKLTVVTVGGSDLSAKNLAASTKDSKHSSMDLSDVGNLA